MNTLTTEGTSVAGYPKVTPEAVEAEIAKTTYWVPEGSRTTVCCILSKSGQAFVGEAHCQPAVPFSANLGERFAREDAFQKMYACEVYKMRHLSIMAHQYIKAA